MKITNPMFLLLAGAALMPVAGCMKEAPSGKSKSQAAARAVDSSDPVKSAESAAPASIASKAAIITVDAKGAITSVRQGSNGWTCMPDNPQTPGHDPMCMDGNGMKWVQAWMAHKDPPAGAVGLMYMLQGGSDASNTDPWGEKPANGKWIETGPHVMVVGADSLNKLYPASATPDTSRPYVMFGGTPYAHLMIPIGDR